eukprot:m.142242 g.142242  ORF g.142242 m.142242 type:complete len:55 (+) comp14052_c1_seq2:708-872(+)
MYNPEQVQTSLYLSLLPSAACREIFRMLFHSQAFYLSFLIHIPLPMPTATSGCN